MAYPPAKRGGGGFSDVFDADEDFEPSSTHGGAVLANGCPLVPVASKNRNRAALSPYGKL